MLLNYRSNIWNVEWVYSIPLPQSHPSVGGKEWYWWEMAHFPSWMLSPLGHRTAKGCNFLRQVGTLGGNTASLFNKSWWDFFCPSPSIHIWIIRGWMSFRKWKLNSESQRKSDSGRGVLREREQRQKRQREKKGKVKKRQGNRRKHRRSQKGMSKNGNAILHGLLILVDPRDRGECMGRLPAKEAILRYEIPLRFSI